MECCSTINLGVIDRTASNTDSRDLGKTDSRGPRGRQASAEAEVLKAKAQPR